MKAVRSGLEGTLPKLAAILASLASLAWMVTLVTLTNRTPFPLSGRAVMVLAIPVGLSLWGLISDRFRKVAGTALLVFSLLVCLISVWPIGLSYLPSAILLLTSKRAEAYTN
jgi:hypothetical protein